MHHFFTDCIALSFFFFFIFLSQSEALILSVAGGSELFQSTQKQFFDSKKSDSTKVRHLKPFHPYNKWIITLFS